MKSQRSNGFNQLAIGKSNQVAWRTSAAPLVIATENKAAGDPDCHRNAPGRRISAALAIAATLAVGSSLHAAAPIIPTAIEHGAATFATHGPLTTVTAANQTIIDYSRFNIPTGDTVRFIQPNAAATVLNRINSAVPSQIDGSLFANGVVYLVNPAGVMFGADSVVDVGQLYAAASHITNQNFLSGTNQFIGGNGLVDNEGVIQASAVNFIGRQVSNEGTILAPRGMVALAAGNNVYLGKQDGNVYVELQDQPAGTAAQKAGIGVSNTGTINAAGGSASLTAGDVYSIAARESGTITAANITVRGGSKSTVLVSGKLDASNQGTHQTGGTVNIGGGQIGIGVDQNVSGNFTTPGAVIDASGQNGGGKILIGVKPDSSSPTGYADAANYDFVSANSTLNANATVSGNGGFIDTSGANLQINPGAAITAVGAGAGAPGEWLLDPTNVDIVDAIPAGEWELPYSGGVFQADSSTPTTAYVLVGDSETPGTIVYSLAHGTSVTIMTSVTNGEAGTGDANNQSLSTDIQESMTLGGGGRRATDQLVAESLNIANSTGLGSSILTHLHRPLLGGSTVPSDAVWGDITVGAPVNVNFSESFLHPPTLTLQAAHDIIIQPSAGVTAIGGPLNIKLNATAANFYGSANPLPALGAGVFISGPVVTDGGELHISVSAVGNDYVETEEFQNPNASNSWISQTATVGSATVEIGAPVNTASGSTGGGIYILANDTSVSNSYNESIAMAQIDVQSEVTSGGGPVVISTDAPTLNGPILSPYAPGAFAWHGDAAGTAVPGVQDLATSSINIVGAGGIDSSTTNGGTGGAVIISGGAEVGVDYQQSTAASTVIVGAGTQVQTGGGALTISSVATNPGELTQPSGSASGTPLFDQLRNFLKFLEPVELDSVPFAGGTPENQNFNSSVLVDGTLNAGTGAVTISGSVTPLIFSPASETTGSQVIIGPSSSVAAGSLSISNAAIASGGYNQQIVKPAAAYVATGLAIAGLAGFGVSTAAHLAYDIPVDAEYALGLIHTLIGALSGASASISGTSHPDNVAQTIVGGSVTVGGNLTVDTSATASYIYAPEQSYSPPADTITPNLPQGTLEELPTIQEIDIGAGNTGMSSIISAGNVEVGGPLTPNATEALRLVGPLSVTTNGSAGQEYAWPALVSGAPALVANGGGPITFYSSIDAANDYSPPLGNASFLTGSLSLVGGAVWLGGNVGSAAPLSGLTVTARSIQLGWADNQLFPGQSESGFSVSTSGGGQDYDGPVILNGPTTLSDSGSGNISFCSTVNSGNSSNGGSLTVSTGGYVYFGGNVGGLSTTSDISNLKVKKASAIYMTGSVAPGTTDNFGFITVVDSAPPGGTCPSTGSGGYTPPSNQQFTLPGASEWDGSGISVQSGRTITISANGQVYIGDVSLGMPSVSNYQTPAGDPNLSTSNLGGGTFAAPSLVPWSLVGRVGQNGTPFEIGTGTTIKAPASGQLYLSVNDNNFADDTGSWAIDIRLAGTSGGGGVSSLTDNFANDSSLDTTLWQVNGPAATAFEVGLSSPPNSIITPDLTFSSTSGMQISGVNGTYQAAGIQSVESFSGPFTVRASVTGIEANANPFVLGITNSNASQNIEIAGNLNPQNGNYHGIWGGTANGNNGSLQTDMVANPSINIPYGLEISVASSGAATLSVSSGGTVLGTASGTVGTGPFYVVLGQWEGLPYTVGPNIADWQSAQVTAGATTLPPGAPPPVNFITPPTIQPPPTITPPPENNSISSTPIVDVGGALTSIGNTGSLFGNGNSNSGNASKGNSGINSIVVSNSNTSHATIPNSVFPLPIKVPSSNSTNSGDLFSTFLFNNSPQGTSPKQTASSLTTSSIVTNGSDIWTAPTSSITKSANANTGGGIGSAINNFLGNAAKTISNFFGSWL